MDKFKGTTNFTFLGKGGKDLIDLKTGKPISRKDAINRVAEAISKRRKERAEGVKQSAR